MAKRMSNGALSATPSKNGIRKPLRTKVRRGNLFVKKYRLQQPPAAVRFRYVFQKMRHGFFPKPFSAAFTRKSASIRI